MGFKRPRVRISTLGPIKPKGHLLFRFYFFGTIVELEASCISIRLGNHAKHALLRVRISTLGPKKQKEYLLFLLFSFLERFELSNANVQWAFACCRPAGSNSLIYRISTLTLHSRTSFLFWIFLSDIYKHLQLFYTVFNQNRRFYHGNTETQPMQQ